MFTDEVAIRVIAGRGGNGVVSWHPFRGGPCGGNGGKGGSIYVRTTNNITSLQNYDRISVVRGENGKDGQRNSRSGKNGRDAFLEVPIGTVVKNYRGKMLYDLVDKTTIELCRGGVGGYGNEYFKSSTNRTPKKCTLGKRGSRMDVTFELKIISDVSLVGIPNAGKSTLFQRLSGCSAKAAPYSFTTLVPNISFFNHECRRILIADIPGIIKGAHTGRGLGLKFLRHVERSSTIAYILDSNDHPAEKFKILREEISLHNRDILNKKHLIILNKIDIGSSEEFYHTYPHLIQATIEVSATKPSGLEKLKNRLAELVSVEDGIEPPTQGSSGPCSTN